MGAKTPQCEADGRFKQVQSWEGYQWCVDENGIELRGTRVGRGEGKPDCSKGLLNLSIFLCISITVFMSRIFYLIIEAKRYMHIQFDNCTIDACFTTMLIYYIELVYFI